MKNSRKWVFCVTAAVLAVLGGCGTLAATPMLVVSVGTSVIGGMANGAVMGGSTIGVLRNAMAPDEDPFGVEPNGPGQQVLAQASTPAKALTGLERACYFPHASGRGLPCS